MCFAARSTAAYSRFRKAGLISEQKVDDGMNEATASNRLNVWLGSLTGLDAVLRKELASLLDSREKERLSKYTVERAKDEFLGGRALLRLALSHYAKCAPQAWSFSISPTGKPSVDRPRAWNDLHFSISHTKDLIAVGVSHGSELGVDVESTSQRFDVLQMASEVLSAKEVCEVQRYAADEQAGQFISFWTLKEAYLKGRGCGLTVPMTSCEFFVKDDVIRVQGLPESDVSDSMWSFRVLAPTKEHRLSIAVRASDINDVGFYKVNMCEVADLARTLAFEKLERFVALNPIS